MLLKKFMGMSLINRAGVLKNNKMIIIIVSKYCRKCVHYVIMCNDIIKL